MKAIQLLFVLLVLFLIGCAKPQSKAVTFDTNIQEQSSSETPVESSSQEQTGLDDDINELEQEEIDDIDISEEDFEI